MFAANPVRVVLAALGAAALVTLAACGDKDIDPPAELVDIVPKRTVRSTWSVGLGGDSEQLRLALRPTVVDGTVYAASHDGEVIALSADTGRRQWVVQTKIALSAGMKDVIPRPPRYSSHQMPFHKNGASRTCDSRRKPPICDAISCTPWARS